MCSGILVNPGNGGEYEHLVTRFHPIFEGQFGDPFLIETAVDCGSN